MTGQCHFCGETAELESFQNFRVCKDCKKGGEEFLNDCHAEEIFVAEEKYDNLAMIRED